MNQGYVNELDRYIDRLMRSTSEGSFLIVGVSHPEDFIQMTGGSDGVQLDFPLVTQRQQMREELIKLGARAEGLFVVENPGSDGARFLDIDVEGSSRRIAAICHRLLKKLFDIDDTTQLTFDFDGLAE